MKNFINPLDNPGRFSLDDKGMGNAFADSVKGESRYVADEKSWFYYTGIIWKKDHNGLRTRELAKEYLDYLRTIVKKIINRAKMESLLTDDENEFIAVVEGLANCGERKTMLDEAMSVHPLNKSDFDAKMNLLNCQNCTIDLDTDEPRKHDPEDFITKVAPVIFDPNAKCQRWTDFSLEIMDNEVETAKYLQKSLSYRLTGDTSQECLFIFFGPTTRNGKGTLMESTMNVLGNYAINMQPDSLAKRKRYSGATATPDIARNVGVRLVNVNEPAEDMVFDAAIIKQLTCSDTITTRFLYGNSFDYRPQFKLYISTNHLPTVTDDTLFSS